MPVSRINISCNLHFTHFSHNSPHFLCFAGDVAYEELIRPSYNLLLRLFSRLTRLK